MNTIELPRQLNGPWNHCLILTYTIDIPFFENALWREFAKSCRNKVLLADGQEFLTACEAYAETGIVHLLNQQYIAEGIFAPRRAHAKAILLTNPRQGRLLVGSGNLGLRGYAAGGELFTQYEYTDANTESLGAFTAIRELVEGIIERGYILGSAQGRIRTLFEETPWLFQKSLNGARPVRHNLQHGFLEQLSETVHGERVEELWIHSPFFDRDAIALRTMMRTIKPKRCFLLVQPGQTSVDPRALRGVMEQFGKSCEIRPAGFEDGAYVHAKLYLLKLPKLAICLQGSPNLSQSAMLRVVPHGNIEVANLHTAAHNGFDDILHVLKIEKPAKSLDELELAYNSTGNPVEQRLSEFRLISGEWREDRLRLNFQGTIEDRRRFVVTIDSREFTFQTLRCDAQSVELKLTDEAARLLSQPVPVAILWRGGKDSSMSNPIFVCNRAALENVLQQSDGTATLEHMADLELEDEEIESLLLELENALIIDHRSIWQIAGRSGKTEELEDEEAIRIDYSEIDYEMLRHHPKLQQYLRQSVGKHGYTHSRLQMILGSITDHFATLMDTPDPTALIRRTAVVDPTRAETEEERVQEIQEQQHRRRSGQRIRRLLTNFINRYLRGIQSREFQEMAGFEVILQNYIIFAHLLWRLFTKDWVDQNLLVDSLIRIWRFFWGNKSEAGYFWSANTERQSLGLRWLREHSADAELLAALWYCSRLARLERWEAQLFDLRDIWQGVLLRQSLTANRQIIEKAWRVIVSLNMYAIPSATQMVDELATLAEFETRESLKKRFEDRLGFPANTCDFIKQMVYREKTGQAEEVDCLTVNNLSALSSLEMGLSLLQEWIRSESLDYYRVICPANGRILFYDKATRTGTYWARDLEQEPLDFGPVELPSSLWDPVLSEMRCLADEIVHPRTRVKGQSVNQ